MPKLTSDSFKPQNIVTVNNVTIQADTNTPNVIVI